MDEDKSLTGGSLTRGQWFALAAAFLGWMFDGVEMGLTPIVSRSALQDLLNVTSDSLTGPWNGRILACFLLGAACGGLAFGWLGDKIGRVRAMILSILTYSLFMGCGYFAAAPWHLAVLLFISALGMGGQWSLGVALVMECWPERHRPKLSGIIGAASNVGFLMIAAVGSCFAVTRESWRWLMLVGASPALLALFIAIGVPESQRWKESKKKGGGNPLIEIFKPALLRKTLLAIAFAAIPLIGTWAAVSGWIPVWADSLAGKDQPHAKAIVQIAISIGAIIGCLVAPIVGGIVGRRPVYFGLCLLSLVSCGYMFRAFDSYSLQFVLMAAVVGCITAAFYGWLPLYLSELFPTRVRATGQGLSFNFGRILAAVGALYMGELVRKFGGSYSRAGATITLIYALGLLLIWFAPETKGKPLPD
jgi:MFS family permease